MFLTAEQLAQRWGVTPRTIQDMRTEGTGPTFVKIGHRSIRYRVADVEAFERARETTATPAGQAAGK